ncbi:MAG: hypothetical protein KDA25_02535 [Phycisphaerales bacterium]|nr:hypothetical protein [Phycisphaerales bacterium]
MNDRPVVVQTEHLSPAAAAWLDERAIRIERPPDDPGLEEVLVEAAGLVVRTYTIVDDALLDAAPRLRVVGRAGVGLDNIDVAACRARGIEVVSTPDANAQAVVEYVLRLVTEVLRPVMTLDEAVDGETWRSYRAAVVGRRELAGCTLGILGLGRVGSRLARVATALGMRVLYHDLLDIAPAARHGAEPASPAALMQQSDVISLHVDGRASNRHLVDASLLDRMKPDAVFVNTSRGFVVDAAALADALRSRPDATALIDVHEDEPFRASYPLLGLPNARLYPHLASRTNAAMERMSWVVRDVMAVLEGRTPDHPAP